MKFDSSKSINSQLPMPSGELSSEPKTFDEVPPVVVSFFRKYMRVGDKWYKPVNDNDSFSALFLLGRSENNPPLKNRINLIEVPTLGWDESIKHLNKVKSYRECGYSSISFNSYKFSKNLRSALILVAKKDLEILKIWKKGVSQASDSENTLLLLKNRIERIEKNSDLKPYLQPEAPKKTIKMGR